MAPPKPLWGQKKSVPVVEFKDVEDDASKPPKPLWGGKKQSAGGVSSDLVDAHATHKKSRFRSINRGSVMAREAVAKAIGRRKAESVYVPRAGPNASGELVTVLKTEDRDYELGATLGHGAYATVRACKAVGTHELYAVKVFKKSFLKKRRFSSGEWKTNMEGVHREIAIMKQLKHPHVMALYDVTASDNHLYMVMDYCPRGAIMETDQLPRPPLDLMDARRWFADTVLGLQYLHFQGVVHHDLKPDNILVNQKGAAVIADFGVSRAASLTKQKTCASEAKGASGTPLYNAPEKFTENKCAMLRTPTPCPLVLPTCQPPCSHRDDYDGTLADVWALGVTLHAMVFGELPFPADQFASPEALQQAVTAEGEWVCGCTCGDPALVELLHGMMRKDPTRRSTLEQIHDAEWTSAVIQIEEEASGGGPRASWKKIVVTRSDVAAAVRKSSLTRSSSVASESSHKPTLRAAEPTITEETEELDEAISTAAIKVETTRGGGAGCCVVM